MPLTQIPNEPASISDYFLSKLEYIKSFTPFVTGLGLLYSGVRLYQYYNNTFNINIYNYIEISELLKVVVKDSLVFLALTQFLLPLYIQFGQLFKKPINPKYLYSVLAGMLIILVGGTFFSPAYNVFFNRYLSPLVAAFSSILLVTNKRQVDYIIALIIFVVVICAGTYSTNLARQVKDEKYTLGNAIHLKDSKVTIKSTPDFVYIGKTSNYVFFYNNIKKEAIVYKMDEIDMLLIRQDI